MVFYYFEHPSQLFKILIHKLYFHRNDEAVLMVADYSYQFEPVVILREKYMKELKFTQMFPFPHAFNWISARSNEEYHNKIPFIYNEHFKKYNIDIGKFKKIYITRDSGVGFETYCLINGFMYTYIETTKNNSYDVATNTNMVMHNFYRFMLKATVSEKTFEEVLYTALGTKEHEYVLKWTYFDYIHIFKSFDNKIKSLFFDLYEIYKIPSAENGCLYFPNNSYNIAVTRNMPMNYAYLANELLLDYYFNDQNIILKPHPLFDFNMYNKEGKIPKIPYSIPSELLRFVPGFSMNKAISVASNAVYDLKDCTKEIISFGWAYNSFFLLLHQLFALMQLFEFIISNNNLYENNIEIGCNGLYDDQLALFIKYALKRVKLGGYVVKQLNELKTKKIIVLSIEKSKDYINQNKILCQFLKELSNNTIVGFVIKGGYLPFISDQYKNVAEYIVPLVIKKIPKRTTHSDLNNEYIFVFCKNKNIREKISEFKLVKDLELTGIQISVEQPKGVERQIIDMKFNLEFLENENQNIKQNMCRQQEKQDKILNEIIEILKNK